MLTQSRLAEIVALAGFVVIVLSFATAPQIVCITEPCAPPFNVPLLIGGVVLLAGAVAWAVVLRLRRP